MPATLKLLNTYQEGLDANAQLEAVMQLMAMVRIPTFLNQAVTC